MKSKKNGNKCIEIECSDEQVEIQGEPEEIICSIDLNIKEEPVDYDTIKTGHFLAVPKQENFICKLCENEFTDEFSFLSHKRKHKKEKLCDICNKIYTHPSHLRIHSSDKPFQCSDCEQRFTMKQNLQRHHLRVHSVVRPHVCAECGKAFPLRDQLKSHSRVHTGERPYSCNLCSKTFSDRSYYGRHMKQHAAVAIEPGGDPQRLYPCQFCDKAFNSYSNLYGHMRTHTPEKRYFCKDCGRGFNRNSHLKSHALTHTKPPKSIKCSICNKLFCSNKTLKNHLINKHDERK